MTLWALRPQEEANLLNPAFCGLVIALAVDDYVKEVGEGMPFCFAFLVLPIVLHKPTREALPQRTTKALSSWLDENEEYRATFADRALALRNPDTQESRHPGIQTPINSRESAGNPGNPDTHKLQQGIQTPINSRESAGNPEESRESRHP
jgi:hypothetical protein